MNKKIILITVSYILGTIGGLYLKNNIIPFLCIIVIGIALLKRKIYVIILVGIALLASIRAVCVTEYINSFYDNCNENVIIGDVIKIVDRNKYDKLVIHVKQINGKKIWIKTNVYIYSKNSPEKIVVGNTIEIKGYFSELGYAKNTGGFNYKKYLQSKRIFGLVKTEEVRAIKQRNYNIYERLINNIRSCIKKQLYRYLPSKNADICEALILGEKDSIDSDIIESFSDSGLSHIIAISGMHTVYIASIVLFITKKLGKRASYMTVIVMLIIFCNIAYNSESVLRATIMLIMYYISKLLHYKSDSLSNLSVAILIILVINPFEIYSVGLIMSSAGTLGIIKLYNQKDNENQSRIVGKLIIYIKNQVKLGFSANIVLIPIIALYYNKLSLMFIINSPIINFLISVLMPVLILFSMCGLVPQIFPIFIQKIIGALVSFLSNCLVNLASFFQNINFMNITITTPSAITVVVYYILVFLIFRFFSEKNSYREGTKSVIKAVISVYVCICLVSKLFSIFDNSLKVYFVDVGQGDCTFIVTPKGNKILIDGGGNENGEDTVGKRILIPYLLDKSVTRVNYIIISHFDTDHVGGILTVMEQLNVDTVIISEQGKDSENYKRFKTLINEKKIKVVIVKQGDKLKIEDDLYFDILWPNGSDLINDNILNNNSIICNLHYKKFSMLFTGDIEKIAEKQIIQKYQGKFTQLKANVLKVGHHGSKTSSTQSFIEIINPKYALIGVGLDNKFGHPNEEVLNRLESLRS